jgi:hypothetical protein
MLSRSGRVPSVRIAAEEGMSAGGDPGHGRWSISLRLVGMAVPALFRTLAMSALTLTPSGARALRALAGLDCNPDVPPKPRLVPPRHRR